MRGLPQDKLGVLIGLDEGCSSARISRYETGVHEPPFRIAIKIAQILEMPVTYLYCADDAIAQLLLDLDALPKAQRANAIQAVKSVVATYLGLDEAPMLRK